MTDERIKSLIGGLKYLARLQKLTLNFSWLWHVINEYSLDSNKVTKDYTKRDYVSV